MAKIKRCHHCATIVNEENSGWVFEDRSTGFLYCRSCTRKLFGEGPENEAARQKHNEMMERNRTPMSPGAVIVSAATFILVAFLVFNLFKGFTPAKGIIINIAGENTAVSIIQKEKASSFLKHGKPLDDDKLSADSAAVKEALESGGSYRMDAKLRYGYTKNGLAVKMITTIEMIYDAHRDAYQFVIKNSGDDDAKLGEYRLDEGTYYIIKENVKTWLLSKIGNEKQVIDVSQDDKIYNFLMNYQIGKIVSTGVMTQKGAVKRTMWGASCYNDFFENNGNNMFGVPECQLKLYKDKPVYYLMRYSNADKKIDYQYELKLFYDKPEFALQGLDTRKMTNEFILTVYAGIVQTESENLSANNS